MKLVLLFVLAAIGCGSARAQAHDGGALESAPDAGVYAGPFEVRQSRIWDFHDILTLAPADLPAQYTSDIARYAPPMRSWCWVDVPEDVRATLPAGVIHWQGYVWGNSESNPPSVRTSLFGGEFQVRGYFPERGQILITSWVIPPGAPITERVALQWQVAP